MFTQSNFKLALLVIQLQYTKPLTLMVKIILFDALIQNRKNHVFLGKKQWPLYNIFCLLGLQADNANRGLIGAKVNND